MLTTRPDAQSADAEDWYHPAGRPRVEGEPHTECEEQKIGDGERRVQLWSSPTVKSSSCLLLRHISNTLGSRFLLNQHLPHIAFCGMCGADNPALLEPSHQEILTERLKLRTLRVSDAERLMPILASKAVMQWTVHLPSHSQIVKPEHG